MAERIYLHLLILCVILCQGIIATSSEDTRESSDFLVRKRRVINHLPGGQDPTLMERAKFLVNIKDRNRAHCVGAILSHYTVITAAVCIREHGDIMHYQIFSGSSYDQGSTVHNVTLEEAYYGHTQNRYINGIALLTVDPPFEFNRNTGFISLHEGALPEGTLVNVHGWGCSYPPVPAPRGVRRRLRSITVPIINHGICENDYRNHVNISENHICTYDARQYCARTDEGTPLVYNGRLVGVYVWKGEIPNRRNPDVFVDLNRPGYNAWVRANTLLM